MGHGTKKVVSTTWFPQKVVLWTESPLEFLLWRFRSKQAIVRHNLQDTVTKLTQKFEKLSHDSRSKAKSLEEKWNNQIRSLKEKCDDPLRTHKEEVDATLLTIPTNQQQCKKSLKTFLRREISEIAAANKQQLIKKKVNPGSSIQPNPKNTSTTPSWYSNKFIQAKYGDPSATSLGSTPTTDKLLSTDENHKMFVSGKKREQGLYCTFQGFCTTVHSVSDVNKFKYSIRADYPDTSSASHMMVTYHLNDKESWSITIDEDDRETGSWEKILNTKFLPSWSI